MFKVEFGTLLDFSDEDVVDGILTIPEGVKKIIGVTEYSCKNQLIKKVIMPKSLRVIEDYAFSNEILRGVKEVVLNDGLKDISNYSFFACVGLREIYIPDSVVSIGESAFKNCTSLKHIKLPNGIKSISRELFYNCEKLEEIEYPNNLEKIENDYIYNTAIKTKIVLPTSVKYIENNAFNSKNEIQVEIDKNSLLKNKEIMFIEKSSKNNYLVNESDNKYLIEFNKQNISDKNNKESISKDYLVLGDSDNLNILFRNNKNISVSKTLLSALHDKQTNISDIEMQYYLKLEKQYPEIMNCLDVFAFNIGLFTKPIKETRVSKSGNEITEEINYAHRAYEFLRNLDVNQLDLNYFNTFNKCEFKPQFAKFILDKNNNKKIIETENVIPGFIAKCYNKFEDVQATNTSNKGNQRQLAPTVEKFINYFNNNKFSNIENYRDLSEFVGKYYDNQITFELAKDVIKKQKESNINHNITNESVLENKFNKVEGLKKSIRSNAITVIKNLLNISDAKFTYEFLDKYDYLNLVLGKLCSCCAHLEGAGEGLVQLSMLHPDFQNLVIRDENGLIIAKSTLYINRDECYGVFNNVEINTSIEKNDYKLIYKKYIQAVNDFVKEYNQENPDKKLKQINVGMGNNDLGAEIVSHNKKSKNILYFADITEYAQISKYYRGDWQYKQYILYRDKDLLKNKNHKDIEKV